jgi:hypothetical protein
MKISHRELRVLLLSEFRVGRKAMEAASNIGSAEDSYVGRLMGHKRRNSLGSSSNW